MNAEPAAFETFWDIDGDLIGLGVSIGSDHRILGEGGGFRNGRMTYTTDRSAVPIKAGEWIKGLILHMDIEKSGSHTTGVKRVTVGLTRSFCI
jgi:hypothetical protein